VNSKSHSRSLQEIRRRCLVAIAASSVVLEGWALSDDLPDRALTLTDLVELAQSATTTPEAKAAIWAEAVRSAQVDPRRWLPVAMVLMVPQLLFMIRKSVDEGGADPDDVAGDLVVGFLEDLRGVDPDMRRLPAHLKRLAQARATRPLVGRTAGYGAVPGVRAVPLTPPAGHVDLILAEAVAHHFLTRAEAELVARTYFEGQSVSVVARELGFPSGQGASALRHAGRKLIEYLDCAENWSVRTRRMY
jgi:hypothetical protein